MAEQGIEKIIKRSQSDFPENPDERLSAILYSVIPEPKAILLGFCLDDILRSSTDLYNRFRKLVVEKIWIPRHPTLKEYVRHTLLPSGMVDEEKVSSDGDSSTRWKISEAGKKYGKPIAAFTLKWAVDNNISMHSILGSSNSAGATSGPFNRIRIIRELELKKGKREADISNALNLNRNVVGEHLRALERISFVKYEHVSPNQRNWSKYIWVKGKNLMSVAEDYVKYDPALSMRVAICMYNLSLEGKTADYRRVDRILNYGNPAKISGILSGLAKKGYLRHVKYIGGEKHSDARLTQAGNKFKVECIDRSVDALSGGKELEELQGEFGILEVNVCSRSRYIIDGMALYEDVSPNRNGMRTDLRQQKLIQFIMRYESENGFGPRWKEIREGMDIVNERDLKDLFVKGILFKETKEGESRQRYHINPNLKGFSFVKNS